ncbi:aldo/keto reductase [Reyranella sp.]|uniref:aldo/keto reductase n=1 Tax=Reyranella sp. TaxID=1929291 RepID=UPI003BAD7052
MNKDFRKLGGSALSVFPIGLGCMSLSGAYGKASDDEGIAVIHHAIDRGVTFLDSSDMYGWGHNESLLGKALAGGRRDKVVLATKFGQTQRPGGANGVDGRPAYVQQACEASLKRLGVDVIDLYYQHRVDPSVPIEDTVGAMAELVKQGKVRALGLSEARPETIRRAHKVHPIAAVQSEYSLLYRVDAEETLKTTRALGISFVAYSPLGRSLLTGAVRQASDIPEGDGRGRHPRFAADNLAQNLQKVTAIEAVAADKGCRPGQVALAWLLAQGPDIVPIPGTKRAARVDENLAALDVVLSDVDLARLSSALPPGAAAGTRYPEAGMKGVYL